MAFLPNLKSLLGGPTGLFTGVQTGVRNHVRLCFIRFNWLFAPDTGQRMASPKGEKRRGPTDLLRQLQAIRVGTFENRRPKTPKRCLLTQIPPELNNSAGVGLGLCCFLLFRHNRPAMG